MAPKTVDINSKDFVHFFPQRMNETEGLYCGIINSHAGVYLNHAVVLMGYTKNQQWIIN